MKRKFFYIFITVAFFMFYVGCSHKGETRSDRSGQETQAAADLIRQADLLYSQREDLAKIRESIALLKRARSAAGENFTVHWKLAQASYFLGKHSTDEKESDKALADGISAARSAIRLNPDRAEGYFWLGACLGCEAEKSPYTKGLALIGEIREAMRKVIEIQPDYMGASAFDALARVELKGSFAGGKAARALEYLEKGLAIDKTNPYMNLHLSEAFLALGRKAEAKKQLETLLALEPKADTVPEYNDAVRQARKLLETKF